MQNEVKQYITIIRSLLTSIQNLDCIPNTYVGNFKEALLFNLTDMVAKTVSKPSCFHRTKFIDYIKNFGDWNDQDRVSLPQLKCYLEKDTSDKLDELRNYVKEELENWPRSVPISIQRDPQYSEISYMWPENYKYKERFKIELSYFTHVELLYAQRNNLIHEMRRKGGPQLFENTTPHYINFKGELTCDKETGKLNYPPESSDTFELFYPYEFYFKLIESSLFKVEKYLLNNNINPYDVYNFDPLWFTLKD